MPSSVEKHYNNFDFLRLLAACIVLYSHCWGIYVKTEPHLLTADVDAKFLNLGTLGVSIFFAISGYLITQSWLHTAKATHFIAKRLLRIYPAIFFNFLLVIFVIAPFATTVPLTVYYALVTQKLPEYMSAAFFLHMPALPHTFTDNPYPMVNASLWTLRTEMVCYGLVLLVGLIWDIRKTLPTLTAIYFILFWKQIFGAPDYGMHIATFLLGGCYCIFERHIRLHHGMALLIAAGLCGMFIANIYCLPYYCLAVVYLCLYFALRVKYLGNVAKYGDFSYGIYIYAWPIQQTLGLAFGFQPERMPAFIVSSFVISFLFAMFSWYAVERPALSFKPITPNRESGRI